ncbi:TnsD family Tn7-like transposition protein [Lyngbya aestuarii]|uniref:TnsD family Tn7-like transposition protein n=1 Tax=Lyngbya aestuarii TaxID=118322 RepID=UPI00403E005F
MVSFFPTPYPDELLYSVIARYHTRSGNRSFRQTDIDLFNYPSQQAAKVILSNNLDYLVNNFPIGSKQTKENLIQNHTLYPFYATFLTATEAWVVKDLMIKKVNSSLLQAARIAHTHTEDSRKFFRFCPLCLEKDTQIYGETYWHRINQTPGVLVCPIHATALHDSLVSLDAIGIHYHAASSENCPLGSNSTTYLDETLQKLLMFAKDIEWLVNSCYLPFQGMAWLRKQYQSYLTRQSFLKIYSKNKFTFNSHSFASHFLEFYGTEFLEKINPILIKKPETYLTNCLLACDVNPLIDRVMHLLLINFLVGSIKDFFSSNV